MRLISTIKKGTVYILLIGMVSPSAFSNVPNKDKCRVSFSGDKSERQEINYEEIVEFIQSLEITTKQQFFDLITSRDWPVGFPKNPHKTYPNWNWNDLGITDDLEKKKLDDKLWSYVTTILRSERRYSKSPEDQDSPAVMLDEAKKSGVYYLQTENQTERYEGERHSGISRQDADTNTEQTNTEQTNADSITDHIKKENVGVTIEDTPMSYENAIVFIRTQGIQTVKDFREWIQSGQKPANFPAHPDKVYKAEWDGWGEFFGAGQVETRMWMSYENAIVFIRTQGIQTVKDFQEWIRSERKPANFPAHPDRVYKAEWGGWGKFLGIKDGTEFMSYEEASATMGNVEAQYSLAVKYYEGDGVEKNLQEAFKWYKKAAQQGHAEAQYSLAYMYFAGEGTTKDLQEAFKWYKEAAEQGHVEARRALKSYPIFAQISLDWILEGSLNKEANPHIQSLGIKTQRQFREMWMSYENAIVFIRTQGIQTVKDFREWIQSGQKPANFPAHPDKVYKAEWGDWGKFLGIDGTEFMSYEEASATMGNVKAQYSLAVKYYEGDGVEKNLQEAFKWYKKAAKQGHAEAQYSLAYMYFAGEGTTKDLQEAFKWYKEAAQQGHVEARRALKSHPGI